VINADRLPTLTTERLRIRWLEASDVPSLFEIFSNADVTRYWGSPRLVDESGARDLLDEIHGFFRAHTLYQWGIALASEDRVIGTCTLAALDKRNRRAELGFALDRAQWKNGYVAEALPKLFDFAFGELRLHRLEADVDPRNLASIRVVERLGFQREGYLRQRWLCHDGPQDTVFYGLLASEWRDESSEANA
jgi:RimJ/RimL family protein N-acetyltransferase